MKPAHSNSRTLCIWLPRWPLERACHAHSKRGILSPNSQRKSGGTPGVRDGRGGCPDLVLYEEYRRGCFRVVACTGKHGITVGMPLAEAMALGAVRAQKHDPLADRAALV